MHIIFYVYLHYYEIMNILSRSEKKRKRIKLSTTQISAFNIIGQTREKSAESRSRRLEERKGGVSHTDGRMYHHRRFSTHVKTHTIYDTLSHNAIINNEFNFSCTRCTRGDTQENQSNRRGMFHHEKMASYVSQIFLISTIRIVHTYTYIHTNNTHTITFPISPCILINACMWTIHHRTIALLQPKSALFFFFPPCSLFLTLTLIILAAVARTIPVSNRGSAQAFIQPFFLSFMWRVTRVISHITATQIRIPRIPEFASCEQRARMRKVNFCHFTIALLYIHTRCLYPYFQYDK